MNRIQPRSVVITDPEAKLAIFRNKAPSVFVDGSSQYATPPKLHDPHVYTYFYTPEETKEALHECLAELRYCTRTAYIHFTEYKSYFKPYYTYIEEMKEKLDGVHSLILTYIINLSVDVKKIVSNDEINATIDDEITKRHDFEHELHSADGLLSYFNATCKNHKYVSAEYINDVLMGRAKICWSAIGCTLEVVRKLLDQAKETLDKIENTPKNATLNKLLLSELSLLSKVFYIFYGASKENENDIFYQKEETDDLRLFLDALEYHEPADKEFHFKRTYLGNQTLSYLIWIASRALKKTSKLWIATSGAYNAWAFKCMSAEKRFIHAHFTLALLDKKGLNRMFTLK